MANTELDVEGLAATTATFRGDRRSSRSSQLPNILRMITSFIMREKIPIKDVMSGSNPDGLVCNGRFRERKRESKRSFAGGGNDR
jgi:hypothetical protein